MLNLNGFVEYYASVNNISKAEAKRNIMAFVDTFKSATFEKSGVNINSFLKSEVCDVPAKRCKNPRTGETIEVPEKKVVKIKISSKFKNMED